MCGMSVYLAMSVQGSLCQRLTCSAFNWRAFSLYTVEYMHKQHKYSD